ncbi:MAG TPA: DCC1-like thiol-disulfide oxidoreductase family protein [Edaphobacter sp.]|nr:DCC1-like thiol-disulfide oxidoreductase family protein [Edaphobacter sp.]
MTPEERAELKARAVLVYDGYCGLCNWVVRFCAQHDQADRLRYVPLQSDLGRELLARYGETPESLNAVSLFLNAMTSDERFVHHSDAVAWALRQLGAPWSGLGRMVGWIPRFLREWGYGLVRRVRYAVFGRYPVCPVPDPKIRSRSVGTPDASGQSAQPEFSELG